MATSESKTSLDPVSSFDDLKLPETLLRGIYSYGFEHPSPIQSKAIPYMIYDTERDLIAQAQSGTGKTGAFSIGSLASIDTSLKEVQVIVLCPTRDLADQIKKVVESLSEYMGIKVHACIGGTSVRDDLSTFRSGVHFVAGTPGRVLDMIDRGALSLRHLKFFILDEADEMLDRGFRDQIHEIFTRGLPPSTRVAIFSATMPEEAIEITKKFMKNPQHILVKKDQVTLEGLKQYYVYVEDPTWKLDTLCDLYESLSISQAIIFVNRRSDGDRLAYEMRKRDFTISLIHSDMEQSERTHIMNEFRSGSARVLIATDLLARGIDVQQVSLVINFDFPFSKENYVHRIGRSARFGRKGVAINLISRDEVSRMKEVEAYYSTQIDELPSDVTAATTV